jgi:hypothetical protein
VSVEDDDGLSVASAGADGVDDVAERAQYEAFLAEQAEIAAAEEAARLAEAQRENAAKTRDSAFQVAMSVIDQSIKRGQEYNEKMTNLEFRDDAELECTRQPAAMTGGTLRDYQLDGTAGLHGRLASEQMRRGTALIVCTGPGACSACHGLPRCVPLVSRTPAVMLAAFRWLVRRSFAGESVILADEMGLGM